MDVNVHAWHDAEGRDRTIYDVRDLAGNVLIDANEFDSVKDAVEWATENNHKVITIEN